MGNGCVFAQPFLFMTLDFDREDDVSMARKSRLTIEERKDYEKRSGLDKLREFIPDKEYTDALIEHAAKNTVPLDEEGNVNPTREAMIERSVALLSYLRDNGYDYSVSADKNEGQLQVKIASTGAMMRILDTDKDSKYVGRVYDNGLTYYFKDVNYGSRNTENITPEASVDLLRYAIGESVHRIDKTGANPVELNETVGTSDKSKYGKPHTYKVDGSGAFTTLYTRNRPSYTKTADGRSRAVYNDLYIYSMNEGKARDSVFFNPNNPDDITRAEDFIEASRDAAIQNFTEELKLEAVDKLAQSKLAGEFDGMPAFSSDSTFIADMQKAYYNERLEIYGSEDYADDNARNDALYEQDERFKQQINDVFGSVSDRTINPVNVSAYMNKSNGTIVNEGNLLRALKTVQKSGNGYEIAGDGFAENNFKDKLIEFDSNPVYDKSGKQIYPKNINPASEDYENLSDFWKTIGDAVNSGLTETGVNVHSIAVDKNGIIHYEGDRHIGDKSVSAADNKVVGNIGQVFEPDTQVTKDDGSMNLKKGLIETRFNSGNNYYIAPGYTAYIVPPVGDDVDKSYEERTRLRGYEQTMSNTIKATLRHDVIAGNNFDNVSGLNRVYHHIYGDKLPLDFEEQMVQEGKDESMVRAIIDSSTRRVRYDNNFVDGTNMLAEVEAKEKSNKMNRGYDVYLDNVRANIAVMNPETSKGIFDPYATGTGTNQGAVRYLTEDAAVDPKTGKITKGESELSPLSAHPDFKYAKYNPPDRLIMSYMNTVNQSSTARGRDINPNGERIDPIGVGTAHMALGGFTQDDAFVVSKEFAETHMIRGKDGNMRPLLAQDKICDHSGNKGVISFIADPNRDPSFYEHKILHEGMSEKEYKEAVKYNNTVDAYKRIDDIFRENPSLDVIGAPYTAPSRFNGGTAREMIDSQEKAHAAGMPTTLKINGKEYPGSIGYCNWVITDMPVDEKTHLYDTEGGRKASGQLIWGLAEAGADKVIDEIYKYNDEPTIKAREFMLSVGLDMSQTGELHRGYEPHIVGKDENGNHIYEQRNEVSVKDAFDANKDASGKLHNKNYRNAFSDALGDEGGFMKLPFPIKLPTGDMTPEKLDENGKGTGEYMLPILAGKYRSGRETVDNKLMVHEFTSNYKDIWEAAGNYLEKQRLYNIALEKGDTEKIKAYSNDIDKYQQDAQMSYNKMADKVIDRHFTGKHNIWKDGVMRKQLHGTGTAVISPDPTLDLDEISMTATTAEALNVRSDDPGLIVWRDPLLSAGGIRYFNVRIIENRPDHEGYDPNHPYNNMVGISMNPSSATSFEGDFDGDSVGLYAPQSAAARKNAKATLSYPVQLLNKEAGDKGKHEFYFQSGLDVAAGVYADKQKGEDSLKIEERMNYAKSLANNAADKSIDRNSDNVKAYEIYNAAMHDAHNAAFGCDVISYASPKEHFESLISMTKSGAKGSPKKLCEGYAPYFGCKAEIDDNYNLVKFEDTVEPYADVSDRRASLAATHAKAVLTGVAGKFSQHAIMMAKNVDEKHVNEAAAGLTDGAIQSVNKLSDAAAATALTHPVTQSVMQLKHDDAETIRRKIDMIHNVAPALWAGHKIERCVDDYGHDTWRIASQKNEKGQSEPVPVTPEEWKKMFIEFYEDKDGLGVPKPNPEHVDTMARIMTVEENGKRYIKGFDDKTKEIMPMEKPLDRLAYESNIDVLTQLADSKAKLFDGSVNSLIAPKTIRDNIAEQQKAAEALEKGETYSPNFKAIAAKDTQVKPVLDTPSVDAVAEVLKKAPDADIHIDDGTYHQTEWSRAGHQRHLADGRVIDVKPATVRRSYDKLTEEDQFAVAKSVFEKSKSGDKSYTKPENEYRAKFKEQYDILKGIKGKQAQYDYITEHPVEMKEYSMYNVLKNQYNEQTAADRQVHYNDLSKESKEAVAQSVALKSLKPMNERNYTDTESEFVAAVKQQHEHYHSFKSSDERNVYGQSHPGAFDEFIRFNTLYKQAQQEASAKMADASKSAPVPNQSKQAVTSSPTTSKQAASKSDNLAVASGFSSNIKKTDNENQDDSQDARGVV